MSDLASSKRPYIPLRLRSGEASYSYLYAILDISGAEVTDEIVLHEISHILTYAGSDFGSVLAGNYLVNSGTAQAATKEERIKMDAQYRFFEAVPEALRFLELPVSRGMRPNVAAAKLLAETVRQYSKNLGPMWALASLNDFGGIPPKGDFKNLPQPSEMEIATAIIHTVMDLVVVRGAFESPMSALETLHSKLMGREGVLIPHPGDTLRGHIREILNYGQRDMVELPFDHINLARVLLSCSQDTLERYLGLLPPLVGIEFLIELRPSGPAVVIFPYQSSNADDGLSRYVNRRLRDRAARYSLEMRLHDLYASLVPKIDGKPVIANHQDPASMYIYAFMSLKSFFRELLNFFRALLSELEFMFNGPHYEEILQKLEVSVDKSVKIYIEAASSALALPSLMDMMASYDLVSLKQVGSDVLLIRPKRGC
ncbi:hypothetical protein E4V01_24510 [Methylorubrum sp. Q1]|uniref:hypothetical protein n=1 Tax=Methylorubrum sp. Q1 TaxID=2562453 RepID=UPI0010766FE5|nr:hypothetical protein [Methylorubrum sp. Q1]TFZ54830.1 hypothetical protein E4V01_24510 [Methylorubrum sp. Q1]